MRIWKATYILQEAKNLEIIESFSFNEEIGRFRENHYYKDINWVSIEVGLIYRKIPKQISIDKKGKTYTIEKGFLYELNKEEQLNVLEEMKLKLKEILEKEKEEIHNYYKNRLNVLDSKNVL